MQGWLNTQKPIPRNTAQQRKERVVGAHSHLAEPAEGYAEWWKIAPHGYMPHTMYVTFLKSVDVENRLVDVPG